MKLEQKVNKQIKSQSENFDILVGDHDIDNSHMDN